MRRPRRAISGAFCLGGMSVRGYSITAHRLMPGTLVRSVELWKLRSIARGRAAPIGTFRMHVAGRKKSSPMLTMVLGGVLLGGGAILAAWGGALFKAGWEDRSSSIAASKPAGDTPHTETDADVLAREQLADLRERRAVEEKERARLEAEAAHRKREAERLEYSNRAVTAVDRLRQEYILSHDGLSPGMVAGTEPLPEEWTNARLKAMGMHWSYKVLPTGGTTLSPTPGNPYYSP